MMILDLELKSEFILVIIQIVWIQVFNGRDQHAYFHTLRCKILQSLVEFTVVANLVMVAQRIQINVF